MPLLVILEAVRSRLIPLRSIVSLLGLILQICDIAMIKQFNKKAF